ncbi:MAG: hypothetical protein GC153_12500 [Alphaproteobacteria bacterium]|nr:hypothetical protein [Alphaproteobacteria bacterium]
MGMQRDDRIMGPTRQQRALVRLLKVARSNADRLEAHLRGLEEAQRSAAHTLDWLRQAEKVENAAREEGGEQRQNLENYLAGAEAKRVALEATRNTLELELMSAREALNEARAEIENLRRLVDAGGGARDGRGRSQSLRQRASEGA